MTTRWSVLRLLLFTVTLAQTDATRAQLALSPAPSPSPTMQQSREPTHPGTAVTSPELEAALREAAQALDRWQAELDAWERELRASPPPGSLAELQVRRERLIQQERDLRTRIGEARQRYEAIVGRIVAALSNYVAPRENGGNDDPLPGEPFLSRQRSADCGREGVPAIELADAPGLFRRVLTAPGARLQSAPRSDGPGEALPLFSILYVSAEEGDWLCAGPALDDAGRGWVEARRTRPWKHMLVMRLVEKGSRQRVLFFDDRDSLLDLVEDPGRKRRVGALYEEIARGKRPKGVVAAEPEVAIDITRNPYLLPIVEVRDAEFDDGELATVVRIAAVARGTPSSSSRVATGASDAPAGERRFRIGIAFVIDTTTSMGPYIDEVRRFLVTFQKLARQSEIGDRVRLALVGYRDNPAPDPRIEYTTRVFHDFGRSALNKDIIDAALKIYPSRVSTRNWREDAVAGMYSAIEELAWEEVDARVIVLVTDASARDPADPLATTPYGIETIKALAGQRDIAVVVLHMRTPEAERADDVARAEHQYRRLARTGDRNLPKYVPFEGNTVAAFGAQLGATARHLVAALERWPATVAAAGTEDAVRTVVADMASADGRGSPVASEGSLSGLLLHEVFARSWLEFVGRTGDATLEEFVEAWAVDRDLLDPRAEALTVAVFLTRKELDDLASRLAAIVEAARKGGSAEAFWRDVVRLSGSKTTDPDAVRRLGELLPAHLERLPYRSKMLSITRDHWSAMPQAQQLALLNEAREKLGIYRKVVEDQAKWIRVIPDDRSRDVYPLELRYLP